VLVFGECGGKILLHEKVSSVPKKYHLLLTFDDGSALSAMTAMWGAMELYSSGDELKRKYICDMRPTPVDKEFTPEYFSGLIRQCVAGEKRSVKSILTQDQLIPGLGNAIAQDIMFRAGLHPKHPLESLTKVQRESLFRAIKSTVAEVTRNGGRHDETDLYGQPGRYVRIMDKNAAGNACKKCGTEVETAQYLGGAVYFCPKCQV
jgi:formamidopyrimidine-DNA glycosylase